MMKNSILFCFGIFLMGVTVHAQYESNIRGLLPDVIQESSGLLLLDGELITHNDSGNDPLLYILDTLEFKVKRSIRMLGTTNTDWEDLAEDSEFIYIADIGNNRGTRTDLRVLRVSKLDVANKDGVFPKVINFTYEDQSDFTDTRENDWDAEALVSVGDSLLVFTKQRKSGGTAVYSLPKEPGNHIAKKIIEYKNVGLITGATRMEEGAEITLVGYTSLLQPFLVSLPLEPNSFSFPKDAKRQFFNLTLGQTEGICSLSDDRFLISSEAFSNSVVDLSASVFEVYQPTTDSTDTDTTSDNSKDTDTSDSSLSGLTLLYQKSENSLAYKLEGEASNVIARAIFDTAGHQVVYDTNPNPSFNKIPLNNLRTAVYYLVLYTRGQTLTRPFLYY